MRAILFSALLLGLGCQRVAPSEPEPTPPITEALVFPDNFLWGTAIAGFQVDAGCPTIPQAECEDPNSDWYQWVTDPDLIGEENLFLSGEPLSDAPGHFELFAEDARISKEILNANALRTSIEWSRLFPNEPIGANTVDDLAAFVNQEAVDHYRAVFQSIRANGLTPLVTLNHYTLPLWLHDGKECHDDPDNCTRRGWMDRARMVKEISLYAGFCAREFGAEIDFWATLNEPFAIILAGYLQPSPDRTNPPGIVDPQRAVEVAFAMIEAHAKMYDAVHAEDTIDADGNGEAAEVGLVHNLVAAQPARENNDLDIIGAQHLDYILNRVFLNALILGDIDADLDGVAEITDDPAFGDRMDYLGINYYTRAIATGTGAPLFDIPLFDFIPTIPFDNFPQGLYEVAMIGAEYEVPIYITENGVSDPFGEDNAANFLVPHLEELHRAIQDGADVRGYFYWSLIDNYEWNHGMTAFRFGFFTFDPLHPLKQRIPKESVRVYQEIATKNTISATLRQRFGLANLLKTQ
jgi:beta-galactosidase